MWIDFYFWEVLDCIKWLSNSTVFDKFPELRAYYSAFLNLPQIAQVWSDGTKCMKYPWFNANALIGGRDSTIMP